MALLACPGSSGRLPLTRVRGEIPLPPSALAGFPIRSAPEGARHRRSRTGFPPSPPNHLGERRRNSLTCLRALDGERGGGVELDARPHGRTDRHLLDEGALGA